MALYIPLIGTGLVELLRGGIEVGPPTLANFFAIHVAVLPALLLVLLVFHFWLIRRAGGLVVRETAGSSGGSRVNTVPWLIQREAAVGLTLLACLFAFSALVDAPLGQHANPSESPNPAKAAWYFMGLQELLLHFHPTFAFFYIPLLTLMGLIAIPFIDGGTLAPGHWCGSRRGISLAFACFGMGFLLSLILVVADDHLLKAAGSAIEFGWLGRGFVPLATTSIILLLSCLTLIKKWGFSRSEAIMAAVMSVMGAGFGLTAIGIWFRGPGMVLIYPFTV
jgi:quinol-cytochrome oxidoreductase complex cytochrome b subunit